MEYNIFPLKASSPRPERLLKEKWDSATQVQLI